MAPTAASSFPESEPLWQSAPHIGVGNRGLNYGDGVFTTFLVNDGRICLRSAHRDRLLRDARQLGLLLDEGELEIVFDNLSHAGRSQGWCVGKVVATREESGRGYAAGSHRATLLSTLYSGQKPADEPPQIAVSLAALRLACQPRTAGAKHLNRLEQVLARAEHPVDTYPELLTADERGNLVEGIQSNVFFRIGTSLCTPPTAQAGVDGVARQLLLGSDAEVSEQPRPVEGLIDAVDELFLVNSVRGVQSVRELTIGGRTRVFESFDSARAAHRTFLQALS